ncbi:hypothetical protein JHD50_07865 [Sulfurimonas sp. MAG313]|nr:hypothetical protein [Sulfurimonas sp. MAG313]MDF1881218.1 hypothetical protein [Sulfurimonas sp. MAG313]
MDILEEFEEFKKPKKALTSGATKKVIAVLVLISLIMFAKLAPYGSTQLVGDALSKQIFILYFFILSQTLGIVHEGGHGVCYILGLPQFFTALNGTLFQLGFPLGIAYYYKHKKQIFPFLIGLFIFGLSLHYTAWYVSTSHEGLFLPAYKSFLGVDAQHDFNYILSQMGLLSYEGFIAGLLRFFAYMVMFYASGKMTFLAFFGSNEKKSRRKRRFKTKK